MSQEARTIRPFSDLGDIGALVDDAVLHFGDATCASNSSIAFDGEPHTFVLRPAKIEWAPDDVELRDRVRRVRESVGASGVRADQLSLLVVAATPYLKIAEIVLDTPVSLLDSLPRVSSLTEPPRPRVFDTPHHGFAVDAFIVLNETVDPRPLLPWRRGTWLAHSRFVVATDAARTLFRLTPMDATQKEQLSLGSKTIRYLHLDEHDPLESFDEQPEKPIFYIDEQILGQLNATSRTPSGKALQLQMAVDFVGSVVAASSRHPDLKTKSLDDIEGSLLFRVLRAAAGAGAKRTDLQTLYARVADDPGWVTAHAEHTIDIQKGLLENLRGADA